MKTKPLALLMLALLPSFFTPANAENNYTYNGHTYFLVDATSWTEAQEKAKNLRIRRARKLKNRLEDTE